MDLTLTHPFIWQNIRPYFDPHEPIFLSINREARSYLLKDPLQQYTSWKSLNSPSRLNYFEYAAIPKIMRSPFRFQKAVLQSVIRSGNLTLLRRIGEHVDLPPSLCLETARTGQVAIFDYLMRLYPRRLRRFHRLSEYVAKRGDLDFFVLICKYSFRISWYTCEYAAVYGHLMLLKYAHGKGYPMTFYIAHKVCASPHLQFEQSKAILHYLHTIECWWDAWEILQKCIEARKLELLEWLWVSEFTDEERQEVIIEDRGLYRRLRLAPNLFRCACREGVPEIAAFLLNEARLEIGPTHVEGRGDIVFEVFHKDRTDEDTLAMVQFIGPLVGFEFTPAIAYAALVYRLWKTFTWIEEHLDNDTALDPEVVLSFLPE